MKKLIYGLTFLSVVGFAAPSFAACKSTVYVNGKKYTSTKCNVKVSVINGKVTFTELTPKDTAAINKSVQDSLAAIQLPTFSFGGGWPF